MKYSSGFQNLVDILCYRALTQPCKTGFTFLSDGTSEEHKLSYQELDQQSRAIAAYLQSLVASGERALLLYQPGLEFIASFFGCLYAGVVAVPSSPPSRSNSKITRLQAIVNDAQVKVVLTTSTLLDSIKSWFALEPQLAEIHWLTTDNLASELAADWRRLNIDNQTLAFLQYTSGSTGTPKGVKITHDNIMHNLAVISQCFGHSSDTKGIIWLPHYHDMGLIGGILQPLFIGFPVVLMSPISFLQKPLLWLQAISKYKGTTSGAPNFAYELCVRKVTPEQKASLNLSSWEVAFNGAEPVRAETLDRFTSYFSPCGFKREAFYPCYGMAETTLIVSGGTKKTSPIVQKFKATALEQKQVEVSIREEENCRNLVGCGQSWLESKIVIVNPETSSQCKANQVGEIWVSSRSVAQGYWNRPQQTTEAFSAYLVDTSEGPFLRTGDLGFLKGEELFVTGRLKDLIIIRGRNYYPQDIELTVEQSHPVLRPAHGAAFAVNFDGQEKLVIAHEIERKYLRQLNTSEVFGSIRQAVAKQHDIQVYAVLLLKTASMPKTSSGKIQRHACRAAFLNGNLNVVKSSILKDSYFTGSKDSLNRQTLLEMKLEDQPYRLESYFQEQVAQVLRIHPSQVKTEQPLSTLGLDSLMVVELKNDIETSFNVVFSMARILQGPSITQLATEVLNQMKSVVPTSGITLAPVQKTINKFPLSYGQKSIWLFHQMAGENTTYHVGLTARLHAVDVLALKQAFQTLVDRHPALRTTFKMQDGEPIQNVCSNKEVCFEKIDASTWSQIELNRQVAMTYRQPFDLEKGPLIRVHLFTCSSQKCILLLTLHHIVCDGWSLCLLLEELGVFYSVQKLEPRMTFPITAQQYSDYVRWQAELLSGQQCQKLRAFWHQQLGRDLPILNLSIAKPRRSTLSHRCASHTFELNYNLTQRLVEFAKAEGVTLYMMLLAVFQLLLYRYSGQTDILVGSPATGRSRAEFADLVGHFVNPVVLRADFSGNPTFKNFLSQVRNTVLAAIAHQDYPFALLVEQLQPNHDYSCPPIFQTSFVLQKPQNDENIAELFVAGEPKVKVNLGDIELEPFEFPQQDTHLDIALEMVQKRRALFGIFRYNSELFETAAISRLTEHFQVLLEEVMADRERLVSELPLLTAFEQHQLLIEWNSTKAQYPQNKCIHQLFETSVEQTPDAIAVCFEQTQLTYQELNYRVNQLACYLRKLGVGSEVVVGLYVERSFETIIGILGILKAGAVYVPLESAYPEDRIAWMLSDAKVSVLLTKHQLVEYLPNHNARVICLDSDWETISQESRENPINYTTASNLAYVIYTSGSTGLPKGVMLEHKGLCSLVEHQKQVFHITENSRILQFASFSFDASIWEIFMALSNGATLCLAKQDSLHSPLELLHLLRSQSITIATLPPSFLSVLPIKELPALQTLIVAGESCPKDLVDRWAFNRRFFNAYGPTESTICASMFKCNKTNHYSPPIGLPIANTQIYLLNRHLQPVPVGVVGELFISGVGLARGYLNRPELTAERFVPNPFTDIPGTRLYRTGDLAQYLPDGNIHFCGRIDNQVKIRGFRIELSEIESVLTQHAMICKAIVIAHKNSTSNQLIAYLVPVQESTPTIIELRQFLKAKLPDYMIPSAILFIEALPLTQNGKVDYKALPRIDEQKYCFVKTYVAPRTLTESLLTKGWEDILGIEQMGIHDDFFELGGNSLHAVQLVSYVNEIFQVHLHLRTLFKKRNIRDLGIIIDDLLAAKLSQLTEEQIQCLLIKNASFLSTSKPQDKTGEVSSLLSQLPLAKQSLRELLLQRNLLEKSGTEAIPRRQEQDLVPLSFAQEHRWLLEKLNPGSPVSNACVAVHLTGSLVTDFLRQSFNEIVRRHEVLRTVFATAEGQIVQLIASELSLPLPIIDLRELSNTKKKEEAQKLAHKEAQQPFNLAQGPLLRCTLLFLDEQEHVLLLTLHHIICDGWSMGVLLQEIAALYHAYLTQQSCLLPELPIQYGDFARWQRKWLQDEMLDSQLAYWKQQLEPSPPVIHLPTDRPRSPARTFQGDTQSFVLPVGLSTQLRNFSSSEDATLFMTLMTAFQTLLHHYISQNDVLVAFPIANRNQSETKSLIGCFVNTLILRTDLSNNPTFRELLGRVRESTINAYAHQHLPFIKLLKMVKDIYPQRNLNRDPIFRVMFAFQNQLIPTQALESSHIQLSFEPVDNGVAMLDLFMNIDDRADYLTGSLRYNSDLYNSSTVVQMLKNFQTLIENFLANPDCRLSNLLSLESEKSRGDRLK